MSVLMPSSQETRWNNLIRIARLTIILATAASVLYVYLSISTKNQYNYLVASSFFLVTVVSFLILRTNPKGKKRIGVWHLLFSITLVALLISTIQANAGTEISLAILIIILVIVIETVPPEYSMRGAILGALASLVCGILAFYSPIRQFGDASTDLVLTWTVRIATLAFLAVIMTKFRTLSLTNKLLISFLGVVVLVSLTFNIVMTTATTDILTDEIGQQLNSAASGRSIIIGDFLNSQVEVLKTLAQDESIRQSVVAANALKPQLDEILSLDEQWRQSVVSGSKSSLITSRLSNSPATTLRAFQAISPNHVELFITDKIGALIAATETTSDYYQADEDWWQYAYSQKDVYISQPVVDESAKVLSILMAVPIYDTRQGDLIGILRTTISISGIINLIDDPIGETGNVVILFPDQSVLDTKIAGYRTFDSESLKTFQSASGKNYLQAISEGEERILARTEIRSQSTSSRVSNLGWSMVVSQKTSEALAPVRNQVRISSFFGTLMAGIAALISLLVAQRLANPILNLTQATNAIAAGNLEARVKVSSMDEIGRLAESFNTMTSQLQNTLVGLEERVADRTAHLEKSSQLLNRRANQFEAIAQLARTISSVQNLETLLPQITNLVSQSFGFYHVGLFLLDESREYAVLSAANSEGGQRMLARKHRLEVGKTGIVGYVTATGIPRIALDTGADAVFFDNPELPETRSEMSLPLRVSGVIVGALDVQSTEANVFSEDDVEVLTILADEISVAIENARLFEESQRLLADAQSAVGKYTLKAWQQIMNSQKVAGYELSGAFIRRLEKPIRNQEQSANIPIQLRDKVIGSMCISLPDQKKLTPDQEDIVQALVQRVGLAIENATFLEESQRAATKEQMISEITGKIGSSINLRNVLQTAVEELGHNIPGSEIVIEFMKQPDQP